MPFPKLEGTEILNSKTKDRYYVGSAADIKNRLGRHNDGVTPSTKPGRPWKVVYTETFSTKAEEISKTRIIKTKLIFNSYKYTMKCGYHIIESLGIILIHKKKCTSSELKILIQQIVQNPFFKTDFNVIFDLRNTEFKLTFDDIKSCGSYLKSYLPLGEANKLAILTKSSEQTKKAVDLLLCYNGKPKCQVFSDLERAFIWMNLNNKDFIVKMRLNYLRHQESYFHY